MNYWTLAFVGDHARDNHEAARKSGVFCLSSERTPIRRARPGDLALFYLAGEGFVADAVIVSITRAPGAVPGWSSKKPPLWTVSLARVRPFPSPILYKFPGKDRHPALGFHRYSLTGGFVGMPKSGFEDVLGWAYPDSAPETRNGARRKVSAVAEESAAPSSGGPASISPVPENKSARDPVNRRFEKRVAGQHALDQGHKQVAVWTGVGFAARLFGLKGMGRFARDRARAAEKTWLAGGKAEERVGEELGKLTEHGFYVFHDVSLPGLGNVDHVVLGQRGFYCIETKSHKGRVTRSGAGILVNGRPPEKDFIKQAWRGCYGLREVLNADVTPLLLFTDAFVEGRLSVRGVRVLPLAWLVEEILKADPRHDLRAVKAAVNALGTAIGSYPSSTPRPKGGVGSPL